MRNSVGIKEFNQDKFGNRDVKNKKASDLPMQFGIVSSLGHR